jgi:hypothetical protein
MKTIRNELRKKIVASREAVVETTKVADKQQRTTALLEYTLEKLDRAEWRIKVNAKKIAKVDENKAKLIKQDEKLSRKLDKINAKIVKLLGRENQGEEPTVSEDNNEVVETDTESEEN